MYAYPSHIDFGISPVTFINQWDTKKPDAIGRLDNHLV